MLNMFIVLNPSASGTSIQVFFICEQKLPSFNLTLILQGFK